MKEREIDLEVEHEKDDLSGARGIKNMGIIVLGIAAVLAIGWVVWTYVL